MAKKSKRVLIIDDEESIRDGCQQILTRMGHDATSTADAETGLVLAAHEHFDLVLLDLRMPKIDGLEILKTLKQDQNIASAIIIITGYGTIPLAVEAMRMGASNFLTKPFSASELKKAIKDVLEPVQAVKESDTLSLLIGGSDYMKDLKDTIRRVAGTDSTVL
ncbi:MAG: response regulator, partial [Desulfomonilia bacterium]|nr:response regulator [Desulfomonilia bacterium]